MFLAIESIRLVKSDAVAAAGKIAQETAVIGSGTIPIRGQKTGAVKGDFHADISIDAGAP
jgi:hypothetical protein